MLEQAMLCGAQSSAAGSATAAALEGCGRETRWKEAWRHAPVALVAAAWHAGEQPVLRQAMLCQAKQAPGAGAVAEAGSAWV